MTNENPYTRKKEPEVVKRALLDSAAQIAASKGFAAVTVQSVADAAHVTKGGLFHHFPNKQALVEGMFLDQCDKFGLAIDTRMAVDPDDYGQFTRAYVNTIFDKGQYGAGTTLASLASATVGDAGLRRLWTQWLKERHIRHHDTDGDVALHIVRMAADGAWYNYLTEDTYDAEASVLHQRLLTMTLAQ